MKFATWNVNSLRARADRVEDWLDATDADVLTIQETKCRDENFPWGLFEMAGYQVAHFGFSQWNGVAIASRVGLEDVEYGFEGQPEFGKNGVDPQVEARAISATVGTKKTDVEPFRLHSLYVPNGRSLEDEHMEYKLRFLNALHSHVTSDLTDTTRLALTGDWNVAPYDEDVWDMELFLEEGLTHVSEPERAAFRAFEDSGLLDVVRPRHPGPETYTYWDYQRLRFPKNEGMRIDFILASQHLANDVTDAWIDREERKGKGPSDHVPVVAQLG
ncbi:MAG: exodeoxyribonuclease III [Yaniella sp.]|uniref:exodeoxyribonuclease III n=1 Tax=Yaniella sp. TaxID=2773929 RepID=UPI002649C9C3|nr:exodeoxyribonuclease III [Yaniella sp.]MDN5732275.1 exodeoxyribonuclease III [Yaniella sp.]MDN5815745.1 exodeoxyribonuclease III [Yaniella sp.]MDN5889996.1 exodeoxyribonuclease III [Yaniella sp.]MDN5913076.1 exodeoxyribonuclease III [Yaniella sp.]MDN6358234.1 exodeoxyribonuclease III [Yaniella sp.]